MHTHSDDVWKAASGFCRSSPSTQGRRKLRRLETMCYRAACECGRDDTLFRPTNLCLLLLQRLNHCYITKGTDESRTIRQAPGSFLGTRKLLQIHPPCSLIWLAWSCISAKRFVFTAPCLPSERCVRNSVLFLFFSLM